MSTQLGYDPASFYVWRASDGFAIHLSLKVVTQLTAQISRAVGESRTGEMRGILLGRTIDTPFRATVIEDFALIPPSDAATQSETSEDAAFEIACRMAETGKEHRALGFFRSQRDGNLNMGPRDLQTFSRLFCETGKVALLIQTPPRGESEAALFYWQYGGPHPRDFGFGFPLEAGQLSSGHPGWRYPNPLDDAPSPVTPPPAKPRAPKAASAPPPPPLPVSHSSGEGVRWPRLLTTAALVVIGIGVIQMATNSNPTVAAAPAPAEATPAPSASTTPAPPPATVSTPTGLGLTITSRPHQLEIRWNRQSSVIAESEKGVMKITESESTQAVPFDQRELREGYVAYTPTTSDVSIRFEVTGKDGKTTSDSIRSIAIP